MIRVLFRLESIAVEPYTALVFLDELDIANCPSSLGYLVSDGTLGEINQIEVVVSIALTRPHKLV